MEKVFNLREFINEDDTQDIEKATEIIDLMQSNNISCKELSERIGYSEQEIAEMYNYLNFDSDLLEKADNYLRELKR